MAGGSSPAPLSPNYDSPQSLKALLDAEGLAMSKRFGQNFLVSRASRDRIIEVLHSVLPKGASGEGAAIWEIGPGIGAMTASALEAGFRVSAFEIDHGFARLLGRCFGARPGFRLVEGDFLKTWKGALAAEGAPAAVFGNLPYNVANMMVALLIERYPEALAAARGSAAPLPPPPMVFTVQKEAALRMAAKPGSKDYSAFSVLCSSACKVRVLFDLGSGSFWPVPNVTSSVVVLTPRPDPIAAGDRLGFSAFVRSGFSSRRKTLKNNLKAAGRAEADIAAALEELGLPPAVRAEALKPEELAAVFARLSGRDLANPAPKGL
ncbi:MAG: ribosomal RNA small subunit methyltransferase A [Spirochaetaceae bacterium]|nr:ribosomal RNA small subunit methyltransferase A [Spirochaetaceae bacterium]